MLLGEVGFDGIRILSRRVLKHDPLHRGQRVGGRVRRWPSRRVRGVSPGRPVGGGWWRRLENVGKDAFVPAAAGFSTASWVATASNSEVESSTRRRPRNNPAAAAVVVVVVVVPSPNNRRGRCDARNRLHIPTSTVRSKAASSTVNPAAAFQRRSKANRSQASRSDNPSQACKPAGFRVPTPRTDRRGTPTPNPLRHAENRPTNRQRLATRPGRSVRSSSWRCHTGMFDLRATPINVASHRRRQ